MKRNWYYSVEKHLNKRMFSSIQERHLRGSDLLGNEFVQPFVAINGWYGKYGGTYQCIRINPMGPMIPGLPGGVRDKEL